VEHLEGRGMTGEEFKFLSLEMKAEQLIDKATRLLTIAYYGYTVRLYSLYNFYVEVYFNPIEKNIDCIAVPETDDLLKYLNWIDIEALMSDNGVY
jgi:hypothetical protein